MFKTFLRYWSKINQFQKTDAQISIIWLKNEQQHMYQLINLEWHNHHHYPFQKVTISYLQKIKRCWQHEEKHGYTSSIEGATFGLDWWSSFGDAKCLMYSWIPTSLHLCLHPAEWSRSCSCGVSQGWGPQLVQGAQPGVQISPPRHYAHTLVSSCCQKEQIDN